MTLSIHQWHQRYQQQALWTQALRKYVFNRVGIQSAKRILEVGCGTGVILDELINTTPGGVFGLDLSWESLTLPHSSLRILPLTQGDALSLPYVSSIFNITLCHFLLLWVKDPLQVVKEMARITRPDGFVLALAEPDYGGRIDFPNELSPIGTWQTQALSKQGAQPRIGRELRSIFTLAGLRDIEVGVLGGQWQGNNPAENFDLEWQVLRSDLQYTQEFIAVAEHLYGLEVSSRKKRHRILYVPTFYAFGRV